MKSLPDFFGILIFILFFVVVFGIVGFIEYWRWQAFITATHSDMNFWMWILIFHK